MSKFQRRNRTAPLTVEDQFNEPIEEEIEDHIDYDSGFEPIEDNSDFDIDPSF